MDQRELRIFQKAEQKRVTHGREQRELWEFDPKHPNSLSRECATNVSQKAVHQTVM